MKEVTLTADQENVLDTFRTFLVDADEKYMIIQGAAGTGKSTLIKHLSRVLEAQYQMYALLLQKNPSEGDFEVMLSATTNKAVAVLKELTNMDATTTHALLNLKVVNDYSTGKKKLSRKNSHQFLFNKLIIIDEVSMVNDELFNILDDSVLDSKIVLIGDQYQLAPIKQKLSIMETLTCTKVAMNKVMRHGGPIQHAGAQYRDTVETGIFKDLPLNTDVIQVKGKEFKQRIHDVFTDPTYKTGSAKVLAWTNKKVVQYNKHIRTIKGYPELFQVGETVFTNNFINEGRFQRKVDTPVEISYVGSPIEEMGVPGINLKLDHVDKTFFFPTDPEKVTWALKKAAALKDWKTYFKMKETWLDLRPAFASTVHKSQGSSYDTVFMDLNDIGKCLVASDVARMMYVGISRAIKQVVLFGNLPDRYRGL